MEMECVQLKHLEEAELEGLLAKTGIARELLRKTETKLGSPISKVPESS